MRRQASSYREEWCDAVWNVVRPYEGLTTIRQGRPAWNGDVHQAPEKLADPLRWRKPRRVFVNSMSDLFHERVPNEFIAAVFGVTAACPQHAFQIRTKRPERMVEWFRWMVEQAELQRDVASAPCRVQTVLRHAFDALGGDVGIPHQYRAAMDAVWKRQHEAEQWPIPNVWLGVSCEDQAAADERIPLLLECPAAVRFVSAEPLLGPIVLPRHDQAMGQSHSPLDWVIVGGPRARACDVRWARSIVRECQATRVPVFVKQLGAMWLEDLCVREFPNTETLNV